MELIKHELLTAMRVSVRDLGVRGQPADPLPQSERNSLLIFPSFTQRRASYRSAAMRSNTFVDFIQQQQKQQEREEVSRQARAPWTYESTFLSVHSLLNELSNTSCIQKNKVPHVFVRRGLVRLGWMIYIEIQSLERMHRRMTIRLM